MKASELPLTVEKFCPDCGKKQRCNVIKVTEHHKAGNPDTYNVKVSIHCSGCGLSDIINDYKLADALEENKHRGAYVDADHAETISPERRDRCQRVEDHEKGGTICQ